MIGRLETLMGRASLRLEGNEVMDPVDEIIMKPYETCKSNRKKVHAIDVPPCCIGMSAFLPTETVT